MVLKKLNLKLITLCILSGNAYCVGGVSPTTSAAPTAAPQPLIIPPPILAPSEHIPEGAVLIGPQTVPPGAVLLNPKTPQPAPKNSEPPSKEAPLQIATPAVLSENPASTPRIASNTDLTEPTKVVDERLMDSADPSEAANFIVPTRVILPNIREIDAEPIPQPLQNKILSADELKTGGIKPFVPPLEEPEVLEPAEICPPSKSLKSKILEIKKKEEEKEKKRKEEKEEKKKKKKEKKAEKKEEKENKKDEKSYEDDQADVQTDNEKAEPEPKEKLSQKIMNKIKNPLRKK